MSGKVLITENLQATRIMLNKLVYETYGVKVDERDMFLEMILEKLALKSYQVTTEDFVNAFTMADDVEKKDFQSITSNQIILLIDNYFRIKHSLIGCIDEILQKQAEYSQRDYLERKFIQEVMNDVNDCVINERWTLDIHKSATAYRVGLDENLLSRIRRAYIDNQEAIDREVKDFLAQAPFNGMYHKEPIVKFHFSAKKLFPSD